MISFPFARHLNVLARGELQARVLGAPVDALRIGIFVASSLLTAACVTTAGTIGFVGLVTPHLVRLMLGADHRLVLPGSALLGGTLVMIADLCAQDGVRAATAAGRRPDGARRRAAVSAADASAANANANLAAVVLERHHVIGLDADADVLADGVIVMARHQRQHLRAARPTSSVYRNSAPRNARWHTSARSSLASS